jgi:hypothetical protein
MKLAHFTVKEYLIAAHANFKEVDASSFITESCLGYLLQFTVPGHLNDRNIHTFQLAKYAAKYWVQHMKDAEQSNCQSEMMKEMIQKIFEHEGPFVTWMQLWDPHLEIYRDEVDFSRRPAPSLYFASFLGLLQPVQKLIEKGADVNAQGGGYGNALQAASCWGHWETVILLIDRGADVNAQGGKNGNALQAASCWGHQETVNLLIDKGANVNAQGGEYGNALQAASSWGHWETVNLLIDKGADVNAQDVNAQGGEYVNAL